LLLGLALLGPGLAQAQTTAADLYEKASAREQTVRASETGAPLAEIRSTVQAYELVVRRYPRSGYCDNALWQGAALALLAFERYHDQTDRRTGERLLRLIKSEYPSSPFVRQIEAQAKRFVAAAAPVVAAAPARPAPTPPPSASPPSAPAPSPQASSPARPGIARITSVTRLPLPTGVRVVIEMDAAAEYVQDQLANPPRVFIDLRNAQLAPSLAREALASPDDVLRAIRVGARPDNATRIVMELSAEPRYTLIALYDPYRLILDFDRPAAPTQGPGAASGPASPPSPKPVPADHSAPPIPVPDAAPELPPVPAAPPPAVPAPSVQAAAPAPIPGKTAAPSLLPAPAAPARNSNGTFSLARQLGLGVSRIVIDPGHGGHDPGALAFSLTEANLVLDIAVRLEALLQKEPGFEVVMTRRADVFIPLEERTAIANREGADLFLSIHANASRNKRTTGVETYYLNFASNPEAEQVAARENSASDRTMRNLSDLVQAIALNNKLDESKDLARFVQDAMVRRIRPQYKAVRNLGVKQAPFVVLVGAEMPSVLAEVSFITNKTEASMLGRPAYRQRLAQALFDAITRYQRSLKTSVAVAQRSGDGARD
jgi:N-acetylmuramoyl-L-alanine amidase